MGITNELELYDGAYVGSNHPLILRAVRETVLGVQQAYQESIGQLSFEAQHDRYTAYVYLMLQLCTAGRAAKRPLPHVLMQSGVMLVGDKRRIDGSTDRLIQLPESAYQVIHEYLEYTRLISISDPRIDSIHSRSLYLYGDGVIPTLATPIELHRFIQEVAAVPDVLPSNWARKLMSSEDATLAPRERDALLGHFITGRHPYAAISSANVSVLLGRMQQALGTMAEALGFCWLPPPNSTPERFHLHAMRDIGDRHDLRPSFKRYSERPPRLKLDVPGLFEVADGVVWKAMVRQHNKLIKLLEKPTSATTKRRTSVSKNPIRIRKELNVVGHRLAVRACKSWRTMAKDEREQLGDSDLNQGQVAALVCKYLRQNYACPVFDAGRSYIAREKLMIDGAALSDLAVLEDRMLPQVYADFQYLPSHPSGDAGRSVSVGRLAVTMIFRHGTLHWAALEAMILAYIKTPPIAVGEVRFLESAVPCVTTNLMCHRLNLLEPFLATLLVNDRDHVLPWLEDWEPRKGQTRRRLIESAIKQYLVSIGAYAPPALLSTLFSAATAQLMLQTSPVVAAYASSKIMTEDLGVQQLLYLMGGLPTLSEEISIADCGYGQGGSQAGRSKPLEDLAQSGLKRSLDYVRVLSNAGGTARFERLRRLKGYASSDSPKHKLLYGFAVHLIEHARTSPNTDKLTTPAKTRYREKLQIVGTVLFGEESERVLNEETLSRWHEEGEVLLEGGDHHAAWKEFRFFLNGNSEAVEAMGFSLGRIAAYSRDQVHNWLIKPADVSAVRHIVESARSGIPNHRVRHAIGWVLDLVRTYGLRRSEALQIRGLDVQGDLIRVQRYTGVSLKTPAATRNLPIEMADDALQEKLLAAQSNNHSGIAIGPRAAPKVDPSLNTTNKLLQKQAGVSAVHFHTIRHTAASGMALALLAEHENMEVVFEHMPWVEELVTEYQSVDVLLQTEPDIGQGLQAISALLGHLHPSTTLRHYIHVLCVALYAANLRRNPVNMRRSFERRLLSPATMQRKQAAIVAEHGHIADEKQRQAAINRSIQKLVEALRLDRGGAEFEVPTETRGAKTANSDDPSADYRFESLEALFNALRAGKASDAARQALDGLYAIPCGKRGSDAPRHPSHDDEIGQVPQELLTGQTIEAATALSDWLHGLSVEAPKDFEFVLDLWANQARADRATIKLHGREQVERLSGLSSDRVRVEVSNSVATITIMKEHGGRAKRATRAIHWVMQLTIGRNAEFIYASDSSRSRI